MSTHHFQHPPYGGDRWTSALMTLAALFTFVTVWLLIFLCLGKSETGYVNHLQPRSSGFSNTLTYSPRASESTIPSPFRVNGRAPLSNVERDYDMDQA
jgi:hypothetical protein